MVLLLCDFMILSVSIPLAVLIRFGSVLSPLAPPSAMLGTWIFFALTGLLFMTVENLYSIRTTVNRIMNIFRIIRMTVILSMIYIVVLFITHFPGNIFLSSRISVLMFMIWWLGLSIITRIVIVPRLFPLLLRIFRFGKMSIVMFGDPDITTRIRSMHMASPIYRKILDMKIHRGELPDDIAQRAIACGEILKEEGATDLIMVFGDEDFDQIAEFCLLTRRTGIPFSIYSRRICELGYFDPWTTLEDYGAISFFSKKWSKTAKFVWRIADILFSLLGMVLFAPFMLTIALSVTLTSPGGILFRQTRIGMNKKPFTFLKFRSMRIDAKNKEAAHKEYFKKYVDGTAASQTDDRRVFKSINSEALTKVGKIIRRTSFDELPQIFNVLRGDMSIVGPRPCIDYELEHYDREWLQQRFLVKPGLTGIWQVYARSRLDFKKAQFLDFVYVLSMSDGVNLRLILKTFPVMLFGKGGV